MAVLSRIPGSENAEKCAKGENYEIATSLDPDYPGKSSTKNLKTWRVHSILSQEEQMPAVDREARKPQPPTIGPSTKEYLAFVLKHMDGNGLFQMKDSEVAQKLGISVRTG